VVDVLAVGARVADAMEGIAVDVVAIVAVGETVKEDRQACT